MAIFAPVFCKGIAVSQTVVSGAAGVRTVTVSAATGLSVGKPLFVAKAADYSQATYLGKIVSVAGTTVTFQIAAPRALTSADKVIVPDGIWSASSVSAAGGVDHSRESGIETLDTTGKELIHTRTKEARDFVELTISDVPAADWADYKSFVEADGLGRFVAAYWSGDDGAVRCDTVKLRAPGDALRSTRRAVTLRSWAVELQVVQKNVFGVTS